MNFSQVLGQLKTGQRVARPGGPCIQLLTGRHCLNLSRAVTSDRLDEQTNHVWMQMAAFTFTVGRDEGDPDHMIDREAWPATVVDLEADDWQIVEFTP